MDIPKLCEKIVFDYYNRNKTTVCTRFIDSADLNRESYKRGAKFTATGISQPSDLIITERGRTFYAEVKSTSNPKGITQSLIKRQAGSRKRILAACGDYVYFIYRVPTKDWYMIDGGVLDEAKGTTTWQEVEHYLINFLKEI